MPRIKLEKRDHYDFQYNTQIKIRDINYGGHLGNDSLVGILHEARASLFHSFGVSELDLGDITTGIIITDLVVNYLGEGHMFDDITVFSHIDEIKKTGFRIFNYASSGEKAIALAETGIRAFDYNERKVGKIPKIFIDRMRKYTRTHRKITS